MVHPVGVTLKPLVRLGKNPGDCWQWLGPTNEGGYGRKQLGSKSLLAHRWLWMQLFGPIPEGLVVNHKCGTRSCVNPAHLEVVTQAANCRHGVATTLSPADVIEIKRARKDGGPGVASVLANRYGVSSRHIREIWGGHTWSRAKPFYGANRNAPQPAQLEENL